MLASSRFLARGDHLIQTRENGCGITCILMVVLEKFGNTSVMPDEDSFDAPHQGVTLRFIIDELNKLGISARGVDFSECEISSLALPAIIHYWFGHYVVLKKVRYGHLFISDPSFGPRVLPISILKTLTSGAAIIIQ